MLRVLKMLEPCETCLELDAQMKGTETDDEWNIIFARYEQHRIDAHSDRRERESVEGEESTKEGFHD